MNQLRSSAAARQSLQLLRDLIEERTGNFYSDDNLELLALKLEGRLAELELLTYLDYYYLLRYDPEGQSEWSNLETAITVNETYFWREPQAFQLTAEVLVPQLRPSTGPLRIWHAACASGEEPFSMAMALDQAQAFQDGPIEILGTDLDTRVLDLARQGIYRQRSVRLLPAEWRELYFESLPGDRWALRPELAGRVSLRKFNLMTDQLFHSMPSFHIIFCRNVLLYFREDRIPALIERLTALLAPGGCLLVGSSESLLRFGPPILFQERGGVVYYRKPEHG